MMLAVLYRNGLKNCCKFDNNYLVNLVDKSLHLLYYYK